LYLLSRYFCNLKRLQEIGWQAADWIYLDQGTVRYKAFIKAVMNSPVYKTARNIITGFGTVIFSRTVLY
jgi:hypothetical protein